jgi:PIN domain nuclease of toxin-antitoxin system
LNVLLDTHTFIWLDTDASRLSAAARDYLTDPTCRLYLSVASVWEMGIKIHAGKLKLSADLDVVLTDQTTRNPIVVLPVTLAHALAIRALPLIHKDPFDRMLVAQATAENAVLLTADPVLHRYPVRADW